VRGLNEGGKRLRVRNLLSLWKVDIVCLQETKVSRFTGMEFVEMPICGAVLCGC
jgi:exonuclease III